ncbi:MAG: glycoside hydrolase family 2, partial [Clostridiales bacterium]|nr:glycoside hydrolase family 2 [Clostridiales bacterium]
RPYYQKLVLDQGYWEDSLLTAPADEDLIKDIQLTKQMGFNGVRKHQKVEDPRYLYHADRLGLLVWGEIGAAYVYSRKYVKRITDEWMDVVLRDYNHPCIVAWTPMNESWGVPDIFNNMMQQAHCNSLYYLIKSLDNTRPVIENDGWEHTCGDLFTIHDYEPREEVLKSRYESLDSILSSRPASKALYAKGWKYNGQPILVTECGGISFEVGDKGKGGWGYSTASDGADFIKRYQAVIRPIMESRMIQGFCYTQLTDVEQEINGLLTYDRKAKVDPEEIRRINEGKWID